MIFSVLISIFAISCKKNIDVTPDSITPGASARMTSLNNVLRFGTYSEMFDTINRLKTKTITQIDSWESTYNFTSMRGLFADIADAEMAISDHMETLPSDSFPKYQNMHSSLVTTYPNVTKEITMYDSLGSTIVGKYYDINVFDGNLAYIVNKDGLVIFGGNTYCYTRDKIKVMTGTNATNFPTLVGANSSMPIYGIVVYNIPISSVPTGTSCSTNRNQWVTSKTKQGGPGPFGGRYRAITYFSQDQFAGSANGESNTKYRVDVRVLQRRVLGSWWDNYKASSVYSSWNIGGNSVNHWVLQSGSWNSYYLLLYSSNTGQVWGQDVHTVNYTIPFSASYGNVYNIYTKNCEDPEINSWSSVTTNAVVKNGVVLTSTVTKP